MPDTHGVQAVSELVMSARTAKRRTKPSAPVMWLHEHGLLRGRILDHGCGYGTDVEWLRSKGYEAYGYDPYYRPDRSVLKREHYDIVLSMFVLNTVFPQTRVRILNEIKWLLKPGGKAYIAVRPVEDTTVRGVRYLDGYLTSKGTFQKPFTVEEILALVEKVFGKGTCRLLKKTNRYILVESVKR